MHKNSETQIISPQARMRRTHRTEHVMQLKSAARCHLLKNTTSQTYEAPYRYIMWPISYYCLPRWREERYIRRGLNPQRAFTGLISSMIHSASKQLKHVKAIFLSKNPLCKKKQKKNPTDSCIGTPCQGSRRSILTWSPPLVIYSHSNWIKHRGE